MKRNYDNPKKAAAAGRIGGPAVLTKYGKEHFRQLALKRWKMAKKVTNSFAGGPL